MPQRQTSAHRSNDTREPASQCVDDGDTPEKAWQSSGSSFCPRLESRVQRTKRRYSRFMARTKVDVSVLPWPSVDVSTLATGIQHVKCQAGRSTLIFKHNGKRAPYGWMTLTLRVQGDLRRILLASIEAVGEQVPSDAISRHLSLSGLHAGYVEQSIYLPPQAEYVQLAFMASEPVEFDIESFTLQEMTRYEALNFPKVRRVAAALRDKEFRDKATRQGLPYVKRGDFRGLLHRARTLGPANFSLSSYPHWLSFYGQLDAKEMTSIGEQLAALNDAPSFSIIMPTYNSDLTYLEKAIASVERQAYPNWQLCIADDASTDPKVRRFLTDAQTRDPRIQVVFRQDNGHISATSNSAIDIAKHPWIAFLDHDDELTPHALLLMADAVRNNPQAKLLYSDEDKLTEYGVRHEPYFKPDFNPDLLRSQNYICHFSVYSRKAIDSVGGLRAGFDGAQDWDLALRVSERIGRKEIVHVPHVLYHWRICEGSAAGGATAKPYAYVAAERAIAAHLERMGYDAEVRPAHDPGFFHTRFAVPSEQPHVTLIVPTRDNPQYLRACVESIRSKTLYRKFDILIVDNNSQKRAAKDMLSFCAGFENVSVIRYPRPFNFSAINNFAVKHAKGEIVGFVNDDVEATHGEWLAEMVGHACRADVGAVGARLLYPDGRLQHAGLILGIGGVAGHMLRGYPGDFSGCFGRARLCQNFSALTAACLLVKKSNFERVGGFREDLTVAFNDVDFTIRLAGTGLWNVYTPNATLLHKESASRGMDTMLNRKGFAEEAQRMFRLWRPLLANDPLYNQNLTRGCEDMSLGFPPRQTPREAIKSIRLAVERTESQSSGKTKAIRKKTQGEVQHESETQLDA